MEKAIINNSSIAVLPSNARGVEQRLAALEDKLQEVREAQKILSASMRELLDGMDQIGRDISTVIYGRPVDNPHTRK